MMQRTAALQVVTHYRCAQGTRRLTAAEAVNSAQRTTSFKADSSVLFAEKVDLSRRILIGAGCVSLSPILLTERSVAVPVPVTDICASDCVETLEGSKLITTESGLQFKDVIIGKGPKVPTGFQAVTHVVTMTQNGEVVDNTKERKQPYDIRVGAGQVVAGLDEALMTMNVGGIRRLYIPGELGFKENLKAAPGRPRIEANSPLIMDVQLLYVPGLDMEE